MRETIEPTQCQVGDRGLVSAERKVRLGFGLALACLVLIAVVSYLSVVRVNENRAWVEHTHEVLSSLELLLGTATDSETAERGYVITGDESYLEPYRQAAAAVDGETKHLRALTADNRAQQQRLDSVVALVTERLANLRSVIDLRKDQGFTAAQAEILTGKGKQFHDRIRRLVAQMEDAEASLLKEREQGANRSSNIAQAIIIGGGLLACGIVALALAAIRRDFAGRARAERALRDANDHLELRVRQPGTIVLLLTGWGQRLVADGDIPPHVDHVLSKPPKLRELRQALARSLDARG
jgi:CHASE3 domain sensor protein